MDFNEFDSCSSTTGTAHLISRMLEFMMQLVFAICFPLKSLGTVEGILVAVSFKAWNAEKN